MICAGVAPMFSSVNVERRSSSLSPRDVTADCGWTVKMMFDGAFVTVTHPKSGDLIMPGFPIRLSDSHAPMTHAPLLGANTDEICESILELPKKRVKELHEQKII